MGSIKKKKKQQTVGFSNTVHVVQYEKNSSQVAKDIWYTETEMKQIQRGGKEVMVLYRSIEGADQTTIEERQYQLSQLLFFRGFESCTRTRQRQKVMSNRCVLHAQQLGMPPSQIAAIYTVVNSWSNTVAAVQAMYDVVDAIHNSSTINAIPLLFSIPSVHDILPPRPHPFAIESVRKLRTAAAIAVTTNSCQRLPKCHPRQLWVLKLNTNNHHEECDSVNLQATYFNRNRIKKNRITILNLK